MMPAPHDMDPDAMTEDERLAKRRFEAYFVFEMMPAPEGGPDDDLTTWLASSQANAPDATMRHMQPMTEDGVRQPERRSRRARRTSSGSAGRVCAHCMTRCESALLLDQHLRFDCAALGRKGGES